MSGNKKMIYILTVIFVIAAVGAGAALWYFGLLSGLFGITKLTEKDTTVDGANLSDIFTEYEKFYESNPSKLDNATFNNVVKCYSLFNKIEDFLIEKMSPSTLADDNEKVKKIRQVIDEFKKGFFTTADTYKKYLESETLFTALSFSNGNLVCSDEAAQEINKSADILKEMIGDKYAGFYFDKELFDKVTKKLIENGSEKYSVLDVSYAIWYTWVMSEYNKL